MKAVNLPGHDAPHFVESSSPTQRVVSENISMTNNAADKALDVLNRQVLDDLKMALGSFFPGHGLRADRCFASKQRSMALQSRSAT